MIQFIPLAAHRRAMASRGHVQSQSNSGRHLVKQSAEDEGVTIVDDSRTILHPFGFSRRLSETNWGQLSDNQEDVSLLGRSLLFRSPFHGCTWRARSKHAWNNLITEESSIFYSLPKQTSMSSRRPKSLCLSYELAWRTEEDEEFMKSKAWKGIRIKVLQRDDYTCQYCDLRADGGMRVNHVDRNPKNNEQSNLEESVHNTT